MNKREFVLAGGGALAAGSGWAAVGPGAAAPRPSAPAADGLAHWQRRIGERFDVFGAASPARLVLQRVAERAGDARTSQFSLYFGLAGAALAPGAQVLRSATGGAALALYLDHAGADGSGNAMLRADFCSLV